MKDPLMDGFWSDDAAVVVGGGPSLRGFNFKRLLPYHTMAINMAFLDCPDAEIVYVGDRRLLERLSLDSRFHAHPGLKVMRENHLESAVCQKDGVVSIPVTKAGAWGESLEDGVCDLGNAGTAALNLADILGADPIYLLGIDCGGADAAGRIANYHDEYPASWRKPADYLKRKFSGAFEDVAPHIFAKVYNCSETSTLNCFLRCELP